MNEIKIKAIDVAMTVENHGDVKLLIENATAIEKWLTEATPN